MEAVLEAQGRAAGIFDHPDNIGKAREIFVNQFLRLNLPPKLQIWEGEIIDHTVTPADQSRRKQVDLAIARDDVPVFRPTEGSPALMPCEAVLATIEVKSFLNKQHLFKALDAIQSFHALDRQSPAGMSSGDTPIPSRMIHYIFAYDGATFKTFVEHINEYAREKQVSRDTLFDMCVVLKRFVIFNQFLYPYMDTAEPGTTYQWMEQEHDNLYFFLISLFRSAGSFVALPTDLRRYFERRPIAPTNFGFF